MIIFQLANQYWAPHAASEHLPFDAKVINDIYNKEIGESKHGIRRIMMLEFSQYLENYLWPNYKGGISSQAHLLSIVVMVNEKFREKVEVWKVRKRQSIF